MNNLKEKKEIIKRQDREIYSKIEKIAATYKNKIIVYNGENLTITNIKLSLWTNQHTAYVIDNLGNEFMLNMYYDYKNHEFIPDGYISLLF